MNFALEDIAGPFKKVPYNVFATPEEKRATEEEGRKRRAEWAVRGIAMAAQSGKLKPEEIVPLATQYGVQSDPSIQNIYAAAKTAKPDDQSVVAPVVERSTLTEGWGEGEGSGRKLTTKGLELYNAAAKYVKAGGKDKELAKMTRDAVMGKISQDQYDAFTAQNMDRVREFSSGIKAASSGNPVAPAPAKSFQKDVGAVAPSVPMGVPVASAPAESVKAVPVAQETPTTPEQKPIPDTDSRVSDLEKQRDEIYSDPTMFSSAIGQQKIKDINSELSQYNIGKYRPSGAGGKLSVYEMKKQDADAARLVVVDAIEAAQKDGSINKTTADTWKRQVGVGNYLNIQKINDDLVKAGYMQQRDAEEISNAIKRVSAEEYAKINPKLDLKEKELNLAANAPVKAPASVAENLATIDNTISQLQSAIDKYPMGKGYSIPVIGSTIQPFRSSIDPDFAAWNSEMAGVINSYMKAFSGTAVTANEMKRNIARLGSPSMTDGARVAVLKELLASIKRERDTTASSMNSSGYVSPNGIRGSATGKSPLPNPKKKDADYYLLKHGLVE